MIKYRSARRTNTYIVRKVSLAKSLEDFEAVDLALEKFLDGIFNGIL